MIFGLQEVSGGMWLQILIGHFVQTRLLEEWVFDQKSNYCVQVSWQGPFFVSEIIHPWNLGTWDDMWGFILTPNSDDGVQASWQGPFFSRNNTSLEFWDLGC